jgi:hypothetical protein
VDALALLVTEDAEFRTRPTRVALHRLRLWATEQYLPRIAFVAVPAEMNLISLRAAVKVAGSVAGSGWERARS